MSLLRFLTDRLTEDVGLILGDTPMFGIEVNDPRFERRFLSRAALLRRRRTELAEVALIVEAMQAEQGVPPAAVVDFEAGPVTTLGSQLLKLRAASYADHPDYEPDWKPSGDLPEL